MCFMKFAIKCGELCSSALVCVFYIVLETWNDLGWKRNCGLKWVLSNLERNTWRLMVWMVFNDSRKDGSISFWVGVNTKKKFTKMKQTISSNKRCINQLSDNSVEISDNKIWKSSNHWKLNFTRWSLYLYTNYVKILPLCIGVVWRWY